ncbi:BatD family protein [Blastopirellula marina]|nr:BatD family protein [Blastopirellula marina]
MKPRNVIATLLAGVAVVVCSAAGAAHAADLRASLSSREAYVGAPITLQLEVADASSHDEPTIPDVAGLDIQSSGVPSRSTQTTIINGRRSDRTSVVYAWQITPRRAGTFEIPSIQVNVDGQTRSTQPIRIVATKSETGDLLFVDITGQQQDIYVGQPLNLTLNLWIKPYHDAEYDVTLSEENMWQMISDSTNWGAFSERMTQLAENRQRPGGEEVLRKDADGDERAYYHYQIDATIYPKRPGQIDADDLQVVLEYPTRLAKSRDPFGSMFDDDFFGGRSPFGDMGMSPFRRNTLSIADVRPVVAEATVAPINVKPIPTVGRPADYRGTVGQYQILTQALPTSVKAGDPITLHIGIRGDGPMELVQAPPLAALPQLTADFKVANEPLAGIVEGDVKLFTTTIRPRREGITEIPAIPLSYFDPTTEKFVTVSSDPIAIHVDPAERLAMDAIVGNATGNGSSEDQAAAVPAFNLTNYDGDDALMNASATSRWPWIILVALLPPLAVSLAWSLNRRRNLWTSFSGDRQESLRVARQSIDAASSPSGVAAALRDFVAANPGSQDQRVQLDALLDHCDHAAFSGVQDHELPALKSHAARLLEEWSTMPASSDSGRAVAHLGWRRSLAVACLAVAAAAIAFPAVRHFATSTGTKTANVDVRAEATATAEPMLTAQQRETLLAEANRAYQDAVQASAGDAAAANEEFAKAATKYGQLVDDGIRNSQLYVNLANAQLQLGSTGKAIANYDRALALDATNWQARQNLAAAQAALSPSEHGAEAATSLSGLLTRVGDAFQSVLSPVAVMTLAAVAWVSVWMIVLGSFYFPSRHWRLALVPTACLLLAAVAASNLEWFADAEAPQAIVAAPTAVLRQAPGEQFPAVASTELSEGEAIEILKVDGDWLQVHTANGSTGWVAHPDVEIL